MSNALATRPATSEYAPYYERYVGLVPTGDIVQTLSAQLEETLTTLAAISEAQAGYRYAPGKWSIKEVIGHIIDSERIFAYRALCFARNDARPIAGFEQDDYMQNSDFDARTLADLAAEFAHVRRGNLMLFRSLSDAAWNRRGIASDAEVSVHALGYMIAGHERHHLNILKERYLSAM